MTLNETGNSQQSDPWKNSPQKEKKQAPPDLDEALKKIQAKFNNFFGAGSGKKKSNSLTSVLIGMLVLLGLYIIAGFFIVDPAERAATFRFGKFTGHVVGPGPHWIPLFIETKEIVNVEQVKTSHHQSQMLTRDENIVSVELAVQYRIGDIEDYLFNVKNPENTLQQAIDSATREVIGHSTLDDILTKKRDEIRQQIKLQVEKILDRYKAGVFVSDVTMQPAKAPDAVKDAFDDAIKAQEDEQRSINRARAYQEQRVPLAQGKARRVLEESEAYKRDVVLQAEGESQRFLALLPEYQAHPVITRQRLYLDAMQQVLGNSTKILVDVTSGNNLFYLPMDKLLGQSRRILNENVPNKNNTVPESIEQRSQSLPNLRDRSTYSRED